jgi:hypothetical protein
MLLEQLAAVLFEFGFRAGRYCFFRIDWFRLCRGMQELFCTGGRALAVT